MAPEGGTGPGPDGGEALEGPSELILPPPGSRGRPMPRGRAMRAVIAVNSAAYRLLRGRGMRSMVLLTTRGARTGRERTTPLAAFKDGRDLLVVASAGGDRSHPAWLLNLARHPDAVFVEQGGRRVQARPEITSGEERERLWRRIVSSAPNFGRYQEQTDRQIPVVRLILEEPTSPR
ncbi:MAG TPA: nitroreductase family deazaflavin-dependent oxidoreductase [Candidatus Nitrosotalea sp.]|nr:nitroreductase family deazaflavin-dependent oxidoreductase [Candidatus Nitrosotalea sp.]